MVDTFGNTYNTGTVSATNGSPTLTFADTLMTVIAIRGDWVYIPSQNAVVFVDAVVDDTHLTLSANWNLTSITDEPYMLLKMSWSRYDPAVTQAKIREYLAFFEGVQVFYFVEGTEPDPALGIDGQWALKVNSGLWQLWYHTEGAWVAQGSPAGIQPKGAWSIATTYVSNDVVTWLGKLWRSLDPTNLGNQPDLTPAKWELMLSNGDRYDITFFDTDRPASGELVAKMMPVGVSFAVGLTTSGAQAEEGATLNAVYSFRKNGIEFATLTFAAGGNGASQLGVFACPVLTTFGTNDIFTIYAPAVRDATLSGVGGNIVGFRQ